MMSCIQVSLKHMQCMSSQYSVLCTHTQLISGIILNVCISIIRDVSMNYFNLFCFFNISVAKNN